MSYYPEHKLYIIDGLNVGLLEGQSIFQVGRIDLETARHLVREACKENYLESTITNEYLAKGLSLLLGVQIDPAFNPDGRKPVLGNGDSAIAIVLRQQPTKWIRCVDELFELGYDFYYIERE